MHDTLSGAINRAKPAVRIPGMIQRALFDALAHDCLNLGQSAAYSAMVSLFPAMIVTAAIIALLPDTAPLRSQVGDFFDQVLPADVLPLLTSYFVASPGASPHTIRALILAAFVSFTGASSVIATLMEGIARANGLPRDCWTFGQRRMRAFLLVPISLIPLVLATILVVFGQFFSIWLALHLAPFIRPTFYAIALAVRWIVSLAGVVGLTALIYHLGTPLKQHWRRTLPGAIAATAIWFVSTLAFGWYVTRFANYGQVYGSLGAGIALLFWLYIVFLSVLVGAEFNSHFYQHFPPPDAPLPPAPSR
ncbi:YihY/virulence factor BrkB family protein [Granulicella tundricola]|uniref:Ribonuclease BN n=1 Tax=Granulicella tundricola (strain ATCC BAA-1859 / DSM 23138 / MP5ACTX9) TaxID=1198114 RepID=E8WXX1_GRATM|nr:YihY/virulence factor BrkB family protein [Granulicella tundricola]ADW69816.1 ribonuclease BN [Granulicella tundricola MP5ACTX9]